MMGNVLGIFVDVLQMHEKQIENEMIFMTDGEIG